MLATRTAIAAWRVVLLTACAALIAALPSQAQVRSRVGAEATYDQLSRRFQGKPYKYVKIQLNRAGYRSANLPPTGDDANPFEASSRDYPERIYCTNAGNIACGYVFINPTVAEYFLVVAYDEPGMSVSFIRSIDKYNMHLVRKRLAVQPSLDRGGGAGPTAVGAPPRSAIYCLDDRPGPKVFAAKPLRGGGLLFALSYWIGERNLNVRGIARRHGGRWEYESGMSAPSTADRCRLAIEFLSNGALNVTADPVAKCGHWGGEGAELQSVQFPASAFEGPVTDELSDKVDFDEVGRCWRTEIKR